MSECPGNCSGSSSSPDQILVSQNVHSKPGARQKSLVRYFGGGGGVKMGSSFQEQNQDRRGTQNCGCAGC